MMVFFATSNVIRTLCVVTVFSIIIGATTHEQECTTSSSSHAEKESVCIEKQPVECGVYMAPSTVGAANLGIYTGIDLKPRDIVNFPEIAIPLLFREWDTHGKNPDGMLWDRYIWNGDVADIESRSDTDLKNPGPIFVPGVGCTINSMLDMHNIHSTHGSTYDLVGVSRRKHPAAGAFTPYHGSKTTARQQIPAGGELFAGYGEEWIPWLPDAIITLNDNLDAADEFVADVKEWMDENDDIPNEIKEGLWDFTIKDFPYDSKILKALPQASWGEVSERFESLTPSDTTTESEEATESESPLQASFKSVSRDFIRDSGRRDITWLQENGKCQDHIQPGKSTIPQAGMGAFAYRTLPKGTVVGYSPLIHMADNRQLLNIQYNDSNGHVYELEDLVINYSFGHRDSTLLLTPYGAGVNYINHDKERANVHVVWPDKELIAHNPEWLSKDLEFLKHTHDKIGLSLDYVALRDIQEGEEIFMDYGEEWEQAWNDHVKNWKPPTDAGSYVHSSMWTESELRTLQELEKNPYPSNLHTMCIESYRGPSGNFEWIDAMRPGSKRVKCHVLERNGFDNGATYNVLLELDAGQNVTVKNVPVGKGIQLLDKANSTDWHLKNAFRHTIMFPDDLFPKSWKNKQ